LPIAPPIINPKSIFLDKNRILENEYFDYKSNRVSLNSNGIWLYDQTPNLADEKFITAAHVTGHGESLSEAKVYYAGEKYDFTTSYAAEIVSIKEGSLILDGVTKYSPGLEVEHLKQVVLPTSLVVDQIQESIANPEIIPFWDLSNFIKQVKQSGFSTLKHELYYKSLIASPVLYISLVLISLACSINLPRNGKLGVVFISGSAIAIFIYFVEKMVNVMALTAVLPINIAVLAPSVAYLLLISAVLIN
jgi:lipopolysaccharide export system permease protein